MNYLRPAAIAVILVVVVSSLAAHVLAPHDYAAEFRDHPNEPPSRAFLLGTDDLGRDRFSRLLYATRVSVLFAPATALIATAIAAIMGFLAGYRGGWLDTAASILIDLVLSLPWLFALLTLRALLPLDVSSKVSLAMTGLLLAAVGWASGGRVVRASVAALRDSPPLTQARAYGCQPRRLFWFHIIPNLRPVLAAQFWILVPVFLLTEANLGLLGIGISEPIPSIGNMLAELQNYQQIPEAPWVLAPAVLLVTLVASLHFTVSESTTCE
jgi:peptide/nickel transport system permease protein